MYMIIFTIPAWIVTAHHYNLITGIREVVAKVFMDLWFTEKAEETPDGLIKRVVSITEAVSNSPDQNCDWFKLLLNQYLKPGDEVRRRMLGSGRNLIRVM